MKKILKIIIIILILIPLFFGSILIFDDGNLKYSEQIEINTSIELVDTLFKNIYNMKKYMPGTKDVILMNGEDGEVGAAYKIINQVGDDSIEMSATLKNNNLPDSLTMNYEMPGVLNIMRQRHKKISENKTLVIIYFISH